MTTKSLIKNWFLRDKEQGNDFMIVMCDTFDHEDYPVGVSRGEFWNRYVQLNTSSMQIVMEVYDLNMPMEEQLDKLRTFNFPPKE